MSDSGDFSMMDLFREEVRTHAATLNQGLIDLDKPEDSKILALIKMGEAEKGGSALVHQKTRKAELEAFADWVKRSVGTDRYVRWRERILRRAGE